MRKTCDLPRISIQISPSFDSGLRFMCCDLAFGRTMFRQDMVSCPLQSFSLGSSAFCPLQIWAYDSESLPCSSNGKESACDAGDPGSVPGSGRSPGERSGNSLQYSCMENPKNRGTWRATVHGVTESQTRQRDYATMIPETAQYIEQHCITITCIS